MIKVLKRVTLELLMCSSGQQTDNHDYDPDEVVEETQQTGSSVAFEDTPERQTGTIVWEQITAGKDVSVMVNDETIEVYPFHAIAAALCEITRTEVSEPTDTFCGGGGG